MKIDTERIIPLTKARYNLKKLAKRGQSGEIFILSDRGKLIAALGPLSLIEEEGRVRSSERVAELEEEFLDLQKRITREVRKKKPNFDSLEALREVRREN